jgi:hypothetical protein
MPGTRVVRGPGLTHIRLERDIGLSRAQMKAGPGFSRSRSEGFYSTAGTVRR